MQMGFDAIKFFLIFRLHQLPASLVPVALGLAYAFWRTGILDPLAAGAVLALAALTQLGGFFLNDYFDHRSGVDWNAGNRTLFSGGSGLIQTGALRAKVVLLLGAGTLGAALALAIWLSAGKANWTLTGIYAFGILSGIFYTAPPVSASYRGWGEVLIAVNYGPTAAELGFAAQTGRLSLPLAPISLTFSGLLLAASLVHEMLDFKADQAAGKRSWVVLAGQKKGKKIFGLFFFFPFVLLVLLVGIKILPYAALLPLGTLVWAKDIHKKINAANNDDCLYSVLTATFKVSVVFGLLLTAGLVLSSFVAP